MRPPGTARRAWRLATGTVRFVGRALRGLIAAAVLLALVVGLPWALSHYIGWPLPHHIPTWAEAQVVLLSPMTTTFLLDFLACLCWIVWTAFAIDVLRCAVDVARGARFPDISAAGPVHATGLPRGRDNSGYGQRADRTVRCLGEHPRR